MWPSLTKVVKSLAVVRHLPLPAAGSADQRGSERENRGAGQLVGVATVAQLYVIFLCSLDFDHNQVGQLNIAQGLCHLPSTWSCHTPGNYIL